MPQLGPNDRCPRCGVIRGYFHDLPGECKGEPPKPHTDPSQANNVHQLKPRASSDLDRYLVRAVNSEVAAVANAIPGVRNDTLNTAAFNLGQLIGAGHLNRDDVEGALIEAALGTGLDLGEIEATLASGLKAGMDQPRVIPDPQPSHDPPNPTTLEDDGTETDPLGRFNLINWHDLKHADDTGEDWLLEPILATARITALYSPPKAGKSILILEIAAALALGRPVLGQPAQPPRRILIIDFENDPIGDLRPRLEDMGYDLDDLEGHLDVATMPSMAKLDTPQGGQDLLHLATQRHADAVIIDTVSRTITGEENDNNTWLAFYKHTGIPLKTARIACLRLDHSGKDAEKGMRGGSAKYGDVDLVWRLTALSETVIHLECTDHRMRIDTTEITLTRHANPLEHAVDGDPFAVAMDAKERELDAALDRLGVPNDVGRPRAKKALQDAGIKVQNAALSHVIKARKSRLPGSGPAGASTPANAYTPNLSGTGRGQPENLSPPTPARPPVRTHPEGVRTGDRSGLSPDRSKDSPTTHSDYDTDRWVACTTCHRPTSERLTNTTNGLCMRCYTNAHPNQPSDQATDQPEEDQ